MNAYINQLKQETNIMTMTHESVSAMTRYEEAVRFAADRVSKGTATYNQALVYVRNNG